MRLAARVCRACSYTVTRYSSNVMRVVASSVLLASCAKSARPPVAPPAPHAGPAPAAGKQPAAKPGAEETAQCVVVYDTSSVDAVFDVTYELDGRQQVVRMERDPGKRIPVEDGELVLTQS